MVLVAWQGWKSAVLCLGMVPWEVLHPLETQKGITLITARTVKPPKTKEAVQVFRDSSCLERNQKKPD